MTFDLSQFGLDAKALQSQDTYKTSTAGSILLLDGDGNAYESAAGKAKPETALRHFERSIYEEMFLAGCEKARVHLTPRGCFKNGRHLLLGVKPYQLQRSNNKKPPLVAVLRSERAVDWFANNDDIEIILNYQIEADDALMIDHYRMRNAILSSADKDLNISPFKSYSKDDGKHIVLPDGDTFGWIDRKHWLTPSLKPASKMIGKGTKFFLAQLLMGDTADNVKGIIKLNGKACGEAGAFEALDPIKDKHEAVNFVIEAYKEINQNIIPEAEAMWLLRNAQDNSLKFFMEHDLTDSNLNFLNECYHDRKWKMDADDYEGDLNEI